MFTGCWIAGHPLSDGRLPFISVAHADPVPIDLLTGPWALLAMSVLVLGDAFLVVVPGEIAVTALGALSSAHGTPPLWAVIGCAALAAALGDAACYLVGRTVGTERWRWMRGRRVRIAISWAGRRLDQGLATVLFTARFVPFARLAVNLVAGASRVHPPRYLGLVLLAATGWALYQASVGAVIGALLPENPVAGVIVSVAVAVALGALIDVLTRTLRPSTDPPRRRAGR